MKLPKGAAWAYLPGNRAGLYMGDEPVLIIEHVDSVLFQALQVLVQGCSANFFLQHCRSLGITRPGAKRVWRIVHDKYGSGRLRKRSEGEGVGAFRGSDLGACRVCISQLDDFGIVLAFFLLNSGVGQVSFRAQSHKFSAGQLRQLSLSLSRRLFPGGGVFGRFDTLSDQLLDFFSYDLESADLLVINSWAVPDLGVGARALRRCQPHLQVLSSCSHVLVGPLVADQVGACMNCVHLARVGEDPVWLEACAHLLSASDGRVDMPVLFQAAAGASAQVCRFLATAQYQAGIVEDFVEGAQGSVSCFSVQEQCGCQLSAACGKY